MNLRGPALVVSSLALVVGLTACSAVAGGHGSTAPTTGATATGATAASPSTTSPDDPAPTEDPTPTEDPSEDPTGDPTGAGDPPDDEATPLRCAGSPQDIVDCLSSSLTAYWRGHLPAGAQSEQSVLLYLPSAAGDPCVRHAAVADGPFTCDGAGRLFFPPAFQRSLSGWFSAADLPYAYASVLSHEYGHFLQLQLHDPVVGLDTKTQAQSRAVEQQADCLSGVWAHHAQLEHGYDAGRFDAVAQELIRRVSSNPEIYTHGTPDDRFTALDRGLGTGRPSSCELAGLR